MQQQQKSGEKTLNISESLNVQSLDLDSLDQESLVLKEESHENLLTASILQQFQNTSIRAAFVGSPVRFFSLIRIVFDLKYVFLATENTFRSL